MQDALRTYLELAMGLTESVAEEGAEGGQGSRGQGDATADQVRAMTTELVATNAANREALAKLVRFEVDRALGVVGLATAEEVAELTTRVRDLERALREAGDAAPPTAPSGPVDHRRPDGTREEDGQEDDREEGDRHEGGRDARRRAGKQGGTDASRPRRPRRRHPPGPRRRKTHGHEGDGDEDRGHEGRPPPRKTDGQEGAGPEGRSRDRRRRTPPGGAGRGHRRPAHRRGRASPSPRCRTPRRPSRWHRWPRRTARCGRRSTRSATSSPMARRNRLDTELVRRGLARSREQAAALVAAGGSRCGGRRPPSRRRWSTRPTRCGSSGSTGEEYVSRGGHKLAGALAAFTARGLAVAGRRCLDAGASTGGFTDVLLRPARRRWSRSTWGTGSWPGRCAMMPG